MNLGTKVQTINKKSVTLPQNNYMMRHLLVMLTALTMVLTGCSSDDEDVSTTIDPVLEQHPARTVMVYIMAENNLSGNATSDLEEMKRASETIPYGSNLVVFVDRASKTELPYVGVVSGGEITKDDRFRPEEDFYASDPERMRETLQWMMDHYPAEDYGLVIWGHASGWLIEKDSIAANTASTGKIHRAYGWDTGTNSTAGRGKWMNIPTMADVLEGLPHKLKFIFADCCNFQTAETAFELRHAADYIIASPAETPACGAPYDKIVPTLFNSDEDFYKAVADTYNAMKVNAGDRVPMAVVRTSEMENLAVATREVMGLMAERERIVTDGAIYYRTHSERSMTKMLFDINDIVRRNIGDNHEDAYLRWKSALDRTVIHRAVSTKWLTAYPIDFSFDAKKEDYGCMSMFVPLDIYDSKGLSYNKDIRQMEWYWAAGVGEFHTPEAGEDAE